MGEKIDAIVEKLTGMFDKWLADFEKDPIRTTIKVVLILYVIKWARKTLTSR